MSSGPRLQVEGPSNLLTSSFVPSSVFIRWGKKGSNEQDGSRSRIDFFRKCAGQGKYGILWADWRMAEWKWKSWSRFLWESRMKMNRGWGNKLSRNWVKGNKLRNLNKLRNKLRNKLSRNRVEGKAGRKVENVTNPSSSSGQRPDTQTPQTLFYLIVWLSLLCKMCANGKTNQK